MQHLIRLILLLCLPLLMPPAPARAADGAEALRTALRLGAANDWELALATAPAGTAREVVQWARLRAGDGGTAGGQGAAGGAGLAEYRDFIARHPDWPGLALLRRKGEAAAARSGDPAAIAAWFAGEAPQTAQGATALVAALATLGRGDEAAREAARAWAGLSFSEDEERAFLAVAPAAALHAVDGQRAENLLWEGRRAEARRMLDRLPPDRRALARARLALQNGEAGVDALIAAVPRTLAADPGLANDRFNWRMARDRYDEAAELILALPPGGLGRPEAWAARRTLLAHWLMRQGRAEPAYRVAAGHGLSAGPAYADLEFLAGFIALRRLNRPEAALGHFAHLSASVSTPISLSRAHYWMGRAQEAMGRTAEAEGDYLSAARQQSAYYGLLAAERLGLPLNPELIAGAAPPDWRQAEFARSALFEAGRLLAAAGERAQARLFFLRLAQGLDARGLAQLASAALDMDEPHIALVIAKAAAERGVILPFAYFPAPAIVPEGLDVSRALALAIARRESEFDPAARSHADARGLMQLLPETGARMARELGLDFAERRLTEDPGFNVVLGAAYLGRMVAEFGPSIALVASGYNAGPNRPRRWIEEYGDPRATQTDVVDWVEMIPFAETRTYVMRVAEALVIYRARLRGTGGEIRLVEELKG